MAVGTRCADHVTPLYQQKLALTSPTGGGRSVGIVRVRTKATEFRVLVFTMTMLVSQAVSTCLCTSCLQRYCPTTTNSYNNSKYILVT